jgi:hypothetical protein
MLAGLDHCWSGAPAPCQPTVLIQKKAGAAAPDARANRERASPKAAAHYSHAYNRSGGSPLLPDYRCQSAQGLID